MTTPDQTPPVPKRPQRPKAPDDIGAKTGAWAAVGKLLSLQLLAVIAVTAIITGIYALAGPDRDGQVTAESSAAQTSSSAPSGSSSPKASSASPRATASSPAATSAPPANADRPKVDVLNQSGPQGTAAKTADRIRAAGWTIGRIDDFRGNISTTTVYYPDGQAKAARALAKSLPGNPRVLPRFSTIASKRITVIITR
jgi:hypothetical protein